MRSPLQLLAASCLFASITWTGLAVAQVPDSTAPAPEAKPTKSQPRSKGEDQAVKWFGMLDADGDGRVSRKEAEVGIRLRPSLADDFKAADLNGDGYLTQEEIRTVAERRRVEHQARRERERTAAARQKPTGGSDR